MLSTPLTCCSIGVATACSTSTALAPVNVVVIWMRGGVISGYWAIGRPFRATAPTMTMTIEMTIATIGRRTKNFDMGYFPAGFGASAFSAGAAGAAASAFAASIGFGFTSAPGLTCWRPSTTTVSPAFTPSETTQRSPKRGPIFTVRISALFPAPTTTTWKTPWSSETAFCGTQTAPGSVSETNWILPYCPGLRMPVGVREEEPERERPGLRVDGPLDGVERPLLGVDRPVGEDEIGQGLPRLPVPLGEHEVVRLGDAHLEVDRVDDGDRRQEGRLTPADEVARLDLRQVGEAGERRLDRRVAEVELSLVERRLRRVELGEGCVPRGDGVVVVTPADGLLLGERLQPGDLGLGLAEPGLHRRDLRLRAGDGRLERLRVDLVEEVPGLHEVALAEVHALEVSLDARPDLDVLRAGRLADQLHRHRDVLRDGLRHEDLGRREDHRLLLAAARGDDGERCEQRRGPEGRHAVTATCLVDAHRITTSRAGPAR